MKQIARICKEKIESPLIHFVGRLQFRRCVLEEKIVIFMPLFFDGAILQTHTRRSYHIIIIISRSSMLTFLSSFEDGWMWCAYVSYSFVHYFSSQFHFFFGGQKTEKPQLKKLCKCNSHAFRIFFSACIIWCTLP